LGKSAEQRSTELPNLRTITSSGKALTSQSFAARKTLAICPQEKEKTCRLKAVQVYRIRFSRISFAPAS
jgi:hypothetical protein